MAADTPDPTQSFQDKFWSQGMAADPPDPTPPAQEVQDTAQGKENPSMGLFKSNLPTNTPTGFAWGWQHQLKPLCQALTQFMGRMCELTPAPRVPRAVLSTLLASTEHKMMKGHRFQHEFSKGNQLKIKESAKLFKAL